MLLQISDLLNEVASFSVNNPEELEIFRLKYLKYLGNTPGHINHWSPAKLKKVLNNFGKVVKIETSIPWIICLTKVLKN